MYIKTKSVHFDAMTIPLVILGKSVCTFFLWDRQGHFWIWIKLHLGRAKGRGKRGYGSEAQNEGYLCQTQNKVQLYHRT